MSYRAGRVGKNLKRIGDGGHGEVGECRRCLENRLPQDKEVGNLKDAGFFGVFEWRQYNRVSFVIVQRLCEYTRWFF